MSETRNTFRLQMYGIMMRNSYDMQLAYADDALYEGASQSELLLELERRFFMNRKEANNIINKAMESKQ